MSLLKDGSKEQLFIDLLKNASRLRLRWTTFKIMNVKGDKQFVLTSALLWCSLYDKSSSSLSSFTYNVELHIFLSLLYVNMCALLSTFLNRLKMKLFPENEWWLHIQIERDGEEDDEGPLWTKLEDIQLLVCKTNNSCLFTKQRKVYNVKV